MINEYFIQIENVLQKFPNIRSYTVTKKIYNARQGFISGTIIFDNAHTLDFTEVKDTGMRNKIKYRYQYMNENSEMIFRYDNAPHHRQLGTFPHHKHISVPDDVKESIGWHLTGNCRGKQTRITTASGFEVCRYENTEYNRSRFKFFPCIGGNRGTG